MLLQLVTNGHQHLTAVLRPLGTNGHHHLRAVLRPLGTNGHHHRRAVLRPLGPPGDHHLTAVKRPEGTVGYHHPTAARHPPESLRETQQGPKGPSESRRLQSSEVPTHGSQPGTSRGRRDPPLPPRPPISPSTCVSVSDLQCSQVTKMCARQRETQVNPERKGVLMTSGEINKNASKCITAKQKEGCLP